MRIEETMSISEKLKILSDAAKYDVACTSSGVQRKGVKGAIGNTAAAGICHSVSIVSIGHRGTQSGPLSRLLRSVL